MKTSNPSPWYEREPKIVELLISKFEGADEELVAKCARAIGDAYSASLSLQKIERSDRDSAKDKKSLADASKAIERAMTHLRSVGWHGGKAIKKAFENTASDRSEQIAYPSIITEAGDRVADKLSEFAQLIQAASNATPTNAPSVKASFLNRVAEQKWPTKPSATAAMFTARECATTYFVLGGQRPTVNFRGQDSVTYGQFLDFVSDAFKALGLSESPQNWSKEAATWFRDNGERAAAEFLEK